MRPTPEDSGTLPEKCLLLLLGLAANGELELEVHTKTEPPLPPLVPPSSPPLHTPIPRAVSVDISQNRVEYIQWRRKRKKEREGEEEEESGQKRELEMRIIRDRKRRNANERIEMLM